MSRASFYRSQAQGSTEAPDSEVGAIAPKQSHRRLLITERDRVLAVLREERFQDLAVPQVYAQLLDEDVYLCSTRTMYRILAEEKEVRERRNQLRHPKYAKPELLATAPNQVWSWDITKLRGPRKWTYFYLYVLLDIFSRYAVGWMVASRESATLGKKLMADLGITKSHSRPYTSDDNPFSEAQFNPSYS